MDVNDILEELDLSSAGPVQQPFPGLDVSNTDDEALMLRAIGLEPRHIDELSRQASLSITRATVALALLELKGQVLQVGRMNYIRSREAAAGGRSPIA
jgi:predicted Rossmann fold nucleotide-binding protein DprA/Smf involved in DNA uptake